MVKNRDFIS
ncbi:hypothetical protein VCCP1035_2267A, partial [Vibrio cholerae CP1035(8)]